MARKPSAETQIAKLKRDLKIANEDRMRLTEALNAAQAMTKDYRARATKAEQERAQWQERFDLLLRREYPAQVNLPPFDPDKCYLCGDKHGANMPCPSLVPMCSSDATEGKS